MKKLPPPPVPLGTNNDSASSFKKYNQIQKIFNLMHRKAHRITPHRDFRCHGWFVSSRVLAGLNRGLYFFIYCKVYLGNSFRSLSVLCQANTDWCKQCKNQRKQLFSLSLSRTAPASSTKGRIQISLRSGTHPSFTK